MTRVAVYTCVTGAYDVIRTPERITPDIDYLCFTDAGIAPLPWQVLPVPVTGIDAQDQNRYIKVHPHRIAALSGYDLTVYVDGSIVIVGNLEDLLHHVEAREESLFLYEHPMRTCIYEEGLACAFEGRASIGRINRQLARYRAEGFPARHGLFEASVMIRRPLPSVARFMERWWAEYRSGVKRDQLSFTYVAWKEGMRIGSLGLSDPRLTQRFFRLEAHNARRRLGPPLRRRVNQVLYRILPYPALAPTTGTSASIRAHQSATADQTAPWGRAPR